METSRVKIEVYCPGSHLDALREAINAAGAGQVGNYDLVCAVQEVTGSWRPLPGSHPFDGEVGILRRAPEYKLETTCPAGLAPAVAAAARAAHPYEEPVIHLIPLLDL